MKNDKQKELCRFITCGNVDDGKSTLIGRMLYDSKLICEDQLESLKQDSKKHGTQNGNLDFALLVDGLSSEKEQGITIDVAYRFFTSKKRKFIIADTPGHEQYTRNMATGASTADIAVLLIDAYSFNKNRQITIQTKRHSCIASLLGIKQFIIAVNKMDCLNYQEEIFNEICNSYKKILVNLHSGNSINFYFIPISALLGDNITQKSKNTPWYQGKTLFYLLDTLPLQQNHGRDFILPVQYINRQIPNVRAFCGNIASGSIKIDDEILILPSMQTSKVKKIITTNHLKIKNTPPPPAQTKNSILP